MYRRKRERQERREKGEQERWRLEKAAMVEKVDEEFSIKIYKSQKQKWEKEGDSDTTDGAQWATSGGGGGSDVSINWTPSDMTSAEHRNNKDKATAYSQTMDHYDDINDKKKKSKGSSKKQYGSSKGSESDIRVTSTASKHSSRALSHSSSSSDLTAGSGKRWVMMGSEHDGKLYSANPLPGIPMVSLRDRDTDTPIPPRQSQSAGARSNHK
jgi:hypothetical protein